MTLKMDEVSEKKQARGFCAECDNDTFFAVLEVIPSGAAKIKKIICAVCGDETEFMPDVSSDFADIN